jgi:hypothetical protein
VPALLELQQAFARSLRDGTDVADWNTLQLAEPDAPQRLAVHISTRLATLTHALALTFPAVRSLVGAEFFEGAAQIFTGQTPPERACLNDYGAEFPLFLQNFVPAAHLSYLPDVARVEWAVSRALHASDAVALQLDRLTALDAGALAAVRFVPHPSIQILSVQAPADLIWRAVLTRDEAAMAAMDLNAGPAWLLVERSGAEVAVRRLAPWAGPFTQRLCAGEPLYRALEQMPSELPAGDSVDAVLADHLLCGRFIDLIAMATTGEPRP